MHLCNLSIRIGCWHPTAHSLVPAHSSHSSLHAQQGFYIKHDGAVAVGALLRLLTPNVATLELEAADLDSQLLTSLCAGTAPIKLQELCIRKCEVDSQLLPALGQVQHLRVLQISQCCGLWGVSMMSHPWPS